MDPGVYNALGFHRIPSQVQRSSTSPKTDNNRTPQNRVFALFHKVYRRNLWNETSDATQESFFEGNRVGSTGVRNASEGSTVDGRLH